MRIDLRSLGNLSPDARAQKISQLAFCVHVSGVSANRFIAYSKDASPAPAREQPPVHVSTSSYIAAVGYPSFCRCVWDGLVDIVQKKIICQNLGDYRKPDQHSNGSLPAPDTAAFGF